MKHSVRIALYSSSLLIAFGLAACTPGERGALIGGAIGAGTGAIVGNETGALVGGAIGAIAGSEIAKNRAHRNYGYSDHPHPGGYHGPDRGYGHPYHRGPSYGPPPRGYRGW